MIITDSQLSKAVFLIIDILSLTTKHLREMHLWKAYSPIYKMLLEINTSDITLSFTVDKVDEYEEKIPAVIEGAPALATATEVDGITYEIEANVGYAYIPGAMQVVDVKIKATGDATAASEPAKVVFRADGGGELTYELTSDTLTVPRSAFTTNKIYTVYIVTESEGTKKSVRKDFWNGGRYINN